MATRLAGGLAISAVLLALSGLFVGQSFAAGKADDADAPAAVSQADDRDVAKFKGLVQSGGAAKSNGNYAEAESILVEAIALGRSLKLSPSALLVPLNNLAGTYRYLDRLPESVENYREVLKLLTDMKATTGIGYATVLDNLAQVLSMQGDNAQAETLQKQSIQIYASSDNPRARSEKALAMANLAQTYISLGKTDEAGATFKDALAIFEEVAPDSPQVGVLLDNYSQLFKKQENYAEAVKLQERAVTLLEKGYGPEHPEVATVLNNIGSTYEELKQIDKAEKCFKRALEINSKVFGPNSAPANVSQRRLVDFLNRNGKADEAKQYDSILRKTGGSIPVPHLP